jgi:hypothetical protein
MTDIEELARRSGARLRDEVAYTLDVDASLGLLRGRQQHQRRTRAAAVCAAVAAAVGVFGTVAVVRDPGGTEPEPAPSPDSACADAPADVQCLSGGRIHVDRRHSFTLTLPDGFESPVTVGEGGAQLYRIDKSDDAGVMFYDDATPARTGQHLTADRLAHWVTTRPFLESGVLRRTTVDGLPAWQVRVVARHVPRTWAGSCNGLQTECWPLFVNPRPGTTPWESGPWRGMASQYTFLDLPGGETFVIWSWAFDKNWAVVDADEDVIRTLRFDPE